MPPLAIVGGIMAAGGIASAAIGSHAAGKAADTQAVAATDAANLQHQDAQDALKFSEKQYATNQANMAPWLQEGKTALGELGGLTNQPGQGLLAPFSEQFNAPTGATEQNDPGYAFRLSQGLKMLDNSAAAKGGLLSGNTLQGEQNYAQNYASNEYGNVYNRAMGEYLNKFNIYNSNQNNEFNRLSALSGTGQTTATTLGNQGNQAASNVGNILLGSGQQIGGDIQNAAAARASGYVGGANAWAGALGGGTNNLMDLILMKQLYGGGGAGPTTGGV